MNNKIKVLTVMMASLMCTFGVAFADGGNTNKRITTNSVSSLTSGEVIDGTSTIIRHKDRVSFDFNTRGLTPDNAYTLWIMHYDKPKKCLDPCACTISDFGNPEVTGGAIGAMAGRVADAYGQLALTNVVDYGVLPTGPAQVLVPNAIKNKKSHFTLILRDHGPASTDPAILEEQLSSWTGACNINGCQDVVISDHPSPFCKTSNNNDD